MMHWCKPPLPAVLTISAALLCLPQVMAHHAFAATYSSDKTLTIEGKVVEFLFRNPHSVVLVETSGAEGQPVTWAVEWGDAGQLSRQGIEKDALKPGDRVIITGNPSRNPTDRGLRMQSLKRSPDGWEWSSSLK